MSSSPEGAGFQAFEYQEPGRFEGTAGAATAETRSVTQGRPSAQEPRKTWSRDLPQRVLKGYGKGWSKPSSPSGSS